MRKVLLSAALGVALLSAWSDLSACGDKFLVVGRGVRYQHIQAAPHAASVLVYTEPDSNRPSAVKDMELQTALTLAGHSATLVSGTDELRKALSGGNFDIVLADLDTAQMITEAVRSAPSKPIFLPVVYSDDKTELANVRNEYGCLLKAPARSGYFLAAIDEAVDVRTKANSLAARKQ